MYDIEVSLFPLFSVRGRVDVREREAHEPRRPVRGDRCPPFDRSNGFPGRYAGPGTRERTRPEGDAPQTEQAPAGQGYAEIPRNPDHPHPRHRLN